MRDQIDCHGSSGECFRFSLHGKGRSLPHRSGNFIYVRGEDESPDVIYVGETESLAEHAKDRWAEAEQSFGTVALYVRLNITAAQRRREHAELLGAYAPPMNTGELRRAG